MTLARFSDVSLCYGKVTALDAICVDLPAGCMVGLIGPDGVGKSSLLALLSGARRRQNGVIEILGRSLEEPHFRKEVQPRIAYMPQGLGRNLYPTLSVAENIDAFGQLFGLHRAERAARMAMLLAATGLTEFANRPAAKLSGGMKQKLGLCCALIHDPDLLILDEPTTGVDPLSRRQFWGLIDTLRAQHPGMSVVIATAYMEEAERFDWLVAMDAGRIVGTGSVSEIKADCATLEEAFIRLLPESRRASHQQLVIPPHQGQNGKIAIEAEHLTRHFGDFKAVENVSFRIATGEIFGFLGSNGCGKTTTMKMLTGLLPPSAGHARVFGHEVDAHDLQTRMQVGYMSQSFSLYGELTVAQNLALHARLFHLPPDRIKARCTQLAQEFDLKAYADQPAAGLPLGIRQRLSLAVAVVHEPKLLILDEPTSGVDPIARDAFWRLLVQLSREQGVTIFISTHFMNEAERCDSVSLMHAGQVLACDNPAKLCAARKVATLEDAFIASIEEHTPPPPLAGEGSRSLPHFGGKVEGKVRPAATQQHAHLFSPARFLGIAQRETRELLRDPIRISVAMLGSLVMMFVLGFGVSMDVENLHFAALDRDQSPESRDYVANIAGSRYFVERPAIQTDKEMQTRMASGELTLALEIPSHYGRDLRLGRQPEIGVWIDGAMPFRAETVRGYLYGLHSEYIASRLTETRGIAPQMPPAEIAVRYRYNQDFLSIYAMVPAMLPLLLIFIPAILMALGVVREKELGSITNFYVTPTTRLEFLLGKQLPYIAVAMLSFLALVLQAVFVFGVPIKGNLAALFLGTLLYVISTTGIGLLISTFTRTQLAALFGTAILTMLPTVQFSGLTTPVTSLQGPAYWIGQLFPASYYLEMCRGVFTKALGFSDLSRQFIALAAFIPALTTITALLLPKQEK